MALINPSHFDEKLKAEIEKVWPLSCKRILQMDKVEFRKLGNFSDKDISTLQDAAVSVLLPTSFKTVADIEDAFNERRRKITTDCEEIDSILGGGIAVAGITELSGASGVGKTQICLQLSITVQYPHHHRGLDAGAVYISTEGNFPSKRLHQMLKYFPRNNWDKQELSKNNFGDRIYVDHVADVESLKDCVLVRLPKLVEVCKVGLIVVDSIAAVFRPQCEHVHQSAARATDIRNVGVTLHKLARTHNLAVLCVNQVADVPDGRRVPALGLAWANLVTTKLQVTAVSQRRELQVLTAPHLPPASAPFVVATAGIVAPNSTAVKHSL